MPNRKEKKKAEHAELVLYWFGGLEGEDPSAETRAQMKRMVEHPRMPSVIRKLISLANPDNAGEDVRVFLDASVGLPNSWEFRKNRLEKNFVFAETNDLKTRAEEFLAALRQHSDLVRLYDWEMLWDRGAKEAANLGQG